MKPQQGRCKSPRTGTAARCVHGPGQRCAWLRTTCCKTQLSFGWYQRCMNIHPASPDVEQMLMVACATRVCVENMSCKKYRLLPCMCCLQNHACTCKRSNVPTCDCWLPNTWPSYDSGPPCPDFTSCNPPKSHACRHVPSTTRRSLCRGAGQWNSSDQPSNNQEHLEVICLSLDHDPGEHGGG